MYLYIHLNIQPTLYLYINLSIYLSIYLSIFPSIYPSIYTFIYPSIYPFIFPFIYPFKHPFIYLLFHLSIFLFIYPFNFLSLYPSTYLSIYVYTCILVEGLVGMNLIKSCWNPVNILYTVYRPLYPRRTTITVDENIIATIKMRINFWDPLKMDSNIGIFSIAPHLVIGLQTLR